MPIIIPRDLPAFGNLTKEKIFVMDTSRAIRQDIRPIEIAILNLMPTKELTETQLLRLLGNTPLQVNVTFVRTASYEPKHTSSQYLNRFYKDLNELKDSKFDGMIVTGAPVESIEFEQVTYWDEFSKIVDFATANVTSTIYICWGAQAALYHQFGIQKHPLPKKLFGVFETHAAVQNDMLLKGMDDKFFIPSSRHTQSDNEAIRRCEHIKILAESAQTGIAICKTHDNKSFYFMGHSEYDRNTLKNEYERDLAKGLDILPPQNYFVDERCEEVNMSWKSTANLLFYNWLNYYVYQVTPFDLQ